VDSLPEVKAADHCPSEWDRLLRAISPPTFRQPSAVPSSRACSKPPLVSDSYTLASAAGSGAGGLPAGAGGAGDGDGWPAGGVAVGEGG